MEDTSAPRSSDDGRGFQLCGRTLSCSFAALIDNSPRRFVLSVDIFNLVWDNLFVF
jgi:hypothetical protein